MRRRRPARRAILRAGFLLALLAAPAMTGCGLTHLQDLNFRVDDRLDFTGPEARSLVRAPLTVSWTMRDFRVAAQGSEAPSRDAGYFAVFVDQSPVKPGQTLDAVADGDTFCQQNPKCPDKAYLKEQQVYTTTGTSLRIPEIRNITGNKEDVQLHSITVVLLDTAGHRIGESAWQLDVRADRVGI
jgi:hypothetical protein